MELEVIALDKFRIGTTVPMRLRLVDSDVAVSWNEVVLKQLCMYSEDQKAYAGYCTYEIDEEDDTVLLAKYPAAQQEYVGKYRVILSVATNDGTATYDALAVELVQNLEDATASGEVDITLSVSTIPMSVIRQILEECEAATRTANAAADAVDDAIDAAYDAIDDADDATEAANDAADAANAAAVEAGRKIKRLASFPWVDYEFQEDEFLALVGADVIVYGDTNDYATGKISPTEDDDVYFLQMLRMFPADDLSREVYFYNIRLFYDDGIASVTDVWREDLAKGTEVYTKIEVDQRIANAVKGSFRAVDELPQPPRESLLGYIYLVPSEDPGMSNAKDEWIVIEENGVYSWERIGKTEIDLSGYLQLSGGTMTGDLDLGGNAIKDGGTRLLKKNQDGAPEIGTLGSGDTVHIGGRSVSRKGTDGEKTMLDTGAQSLSDSEKAQVRTNIGAQEVLTFDTEPVEGSTNPITSGGVYDALQIILDAEYPRAVALLDEEF